MAMTTARLRISVPSESFTTRSAPRAAILGRRPHQVELRPEHRGLPEGLHSQLASADATRKAEEVPDPRAGRSLATHGLALDDQGPESLRRGVDRRRESGRATPDDGHVEALVQGCVDIERVGDRRVRWIRHRQPVEDDDHREVGGRHPQPAKLRVPLRRGCVNEVVQQPVASEDVPELVRAGRARVPDAADRLEPDSLEPRPVREERADGLVELLVRLDPGLEDEVVHRPERHRFEQRCVARAIPPVDEETAPRDRVELPDPAEELDARDWRHPVDRQHQRDGTFGLLARPQGFQRLATRGGLENLVVLPVAFSQLLPEPGELLGLDVDDEDRCPGHQWLTPAPVAPGR